MKKHTVETTIAIVFNCIKTGKIFEMDETQHRSLLNVDKDDWTTDKADFSYSLSVQFGTVRCKST